MEQYTQIYCCYYRFRFRIIEMSLSRAHKYWNSGMVKSQWIRLVPRWLQWHGWIKVNKELFRIHGWWMNGSWWKCINDPTRVRSLLRGTGMHARDRHRIEYGYGTRQPVWMVIKNNAKMGITQRLKTSKVEIFKWNPMWSLTKARPHVKKKKSEQSL